MYQVFINRVGTTCRWNEEQVIERIVQAHRDGDKWDVRMATSGQGHRLLTDTEAEALIAKVTEALA